MQLLGGSTSGRAPPAASRRRLLRSPLPLQDCSIDLLPIGDPAATCTEPLAATFPDNQMRAYYATTTKIISTLPIDVASR